jgi:hypothetical protein
MSSELNRGDAGTRVPRTDEHDDDPGEPEYPR